MTTDTVEFRGKQWPVGKLNIGTEKIPHIVWVIQEEMDKLFINEKNGHWYPGAQVLAYHVWYICTPEEWTLYEAMDDKSVIKAIKGTKTNK